MRSVLLWVLLVATAACVDSGAPAQPEAREKCPVCGMFVAKYPNWVAEVRFSDGKTVFFDGTKDMFKYLFDISTYDPGRSTDSVAAIRVTDYYTVSKVDARTAVFVVGSDVLGPMGRELVPFASEATAEEFMRDHHGKRRVRFDEVDPELIVSLD